MGRKIPKERKTQRNRVDYYYNKLSKLSEEEFNTLISNLLEKEKENYKTNNLEVTYLLYDIAKKYGEEITEETSRETYDRTFLFRNKVFHGVHGQGFIVFIDN